MRAIGLLTPTVLLAVGAVLCSVGAVAQQAPPQIQPPANERLVLQVHAKGFQVYTCKEDVDRYAWELKGPEAELFDKGGKFFGKHYYGPTWEANDGSKIVGKAAANVPSPDADSIPWLLVTVVDHSGKGALASVTSIQRLNTKGGKALSSGCDNTHAAEELRVPYSADYLFFAPK
ncbi:MAG: DUF3455 domain-containing protein [Candidatus Acidiferrum sp.]|jgi:hypothetical protein